VGLVYSSYGGLTVAEHGADEASVRAALKKLDPDLRLVRDDTEGRVYRVFKFLGPSTPAVWICDWRSDDGEPLPLTHRLVDRVAGLRVGSRMPESDPVENNRRLEEEAAVERRERLDELARDGERRMKTAPCFKPSVALRMSRDKQRARGWNV